MKQIAHMQSGWETRVVAGEASFSLPPPRRKVVLWHATSACNIECTYCYGSFEGQSYKKNAKNRRKVPRDRLIHTANQIGQLGFSRAHICGGEPFMQPHLWEILDVLNRVNVETFILTNATFIPTQLDAAIRQRRITNLSFSLDSINPTVNDQVREKTSIVKGNIERIVSEYGGPDIEFGLYSVVTRQTAAGLVELLEWATNLGINYVSFQVVYLPTDHSMFAELSITERERPVVENALESLRKHQTLKRIPSEALFGLSRVALDGIHAVAENCFVERELNYLFIDGEGEVRRCATKADSSNYLGSIIDADLADLVASISFGEAMCKSLCGDCIGMWETAHAR